MGLQHVTWTGTRSWLGLALVVACAGGALATRPEPAPAAAATVPLRFEANEGQLEDGVRFVARGRGYALYLTRAGATLALRRAGDATAVVSMRLVGGREVEPRGFGPLAGTSSYLVGDRSRWRTGITGHAGVRYAAVRPGVDLVYYGRGQRELEYDVVLAPGADPHAVGVAFEGVDRITVDGAGNAVLAMAGGGELRKAPPFAYQEVGGARRPVPARYRLRDDGALGFAVEDHDTTRPLVIDPVLTYSTYLGGSNSDGAEAIATDGAGNLYVAGYTLSTNFPTIAPLQAANAGAQDVFVTKLDPTGTAVLYSTYLGGNGEDRVTALAVDGAGAVYLAGYTSSTNFPTVAPLQAARAGAQDAFVSKLDASGGALIYSTYLGGAGADAAYGLAVDGAGAAHVVGYTTSTGFPTAAPLQGALVGSSDAFAAKLNPAGSALVYATFLGGNSEEVANGVALDGLGNAHLVGWTASTNFPVVAPVQAALGGSSDVFVSRLDPQGSVLLSSTYLGGSGLDVGEAIALDAGNSAHVAGYTNSANFPTAAPVQAVFGGTYDGFVSKLAPTGSALVYSTYLGGSFFDRVHAIGVSPAGSAYVAGYTESRDFPVVLPAVQAAHGGGLGDAFVSAFTASGTALTSSSYLGGSSEDNGHALVAGGAHVHVAGTTRSTNFPLQQPLQGAAGGPYDAFITRFAVSSVSVPAARPATTVALAGLLLGLTLVLAPRRRR